MAKKNGKAPRWTASERTADGMQMFDAKPFSLVRGGAKHNLRFVAPPSFADAAKMPAEKQAEWYRIFVNGALSAAVKVYKGQNDTTIKLRGERVDALTLKPSVLARFLTNVYQAATDSGKTLPDKLVAIANKAIAAKIVEQTTTDEDGAKLTVFKPLAK